MTVRQVGVKEEGKSYLGFLLRMSIWEGDVVVSNWTFQTIHLQSWVLVITGRDPPVVHLDPMQGQLSKISNGEQELPSRQKDKATRSRDDGLVWPD